MPLSNPIGATNQMAAAVANDLTVGESVIPRLNVYTASATTSGQLRMTYWTARKTQTITQVRVITGTTAAAATPTLIRMGIYSVAADDSITLIASTPSDTTLFATAQTAYTKALSASVVLTAGVRYGFGRIIVSATTMPTFPAMAFGQDQSPGPRAEATISPILARLLSGQADLPATVTGNNASWVTTAMMEYAVVLP